MVYFILIQYNYKIVLHYITIDIVVHDNLWNKALDSLNTDILQHECHTFKKE